MNEIALELFEFNKACVRYFYDRGYQTMKTVKETKRLSVQKLGYGIGNTPLQTIALTIEGVTQTIHLKLEGFNPTQSMKDRTAYALIQDLEERGNLHKTSTIVESTSGNLGVAMGRLCQLKGYRFIAVADPKTTDENMIKLRSFGAQVEIVTELDKNGGYLLSRLAHIRHMIEDQPDYMWSNQYGNPANPLIHYNSTGPEIYEQMQRQVDVVFAPVSTGGTLAGIGKFFREVLPSTKIVGVDAFGSIIFGSAPTARKLTGIGSSQRSTFLHKELYDEYILVKDEEAFAFCRFLFASTGIAVGGSSGAVLAACARYLSQHRDMKHVVCICADHGENYRSSIFSDIWLKDQGIELSATHLGQVEHVHAL